MCYQNRLYIGPEHQPQFNSKDQSQSSFLNTVELNYKLITRLSPKAFQLRNTILHNVKVKEETSM